MKSIRRPLAILRMATIRAIGKFILRAKTIVLNLDNHPLIFVTPAPTTAAVTGDITDLDAAEAVAETRVAGSAAARNEKYDIVLNDLRDLLTYVQKLADDAGDENAAIAIIQASGFDLKIRGVRVKPDLEVKQGLASGQVRMIAKASPRSEGPAMYEWQKSTDGILWQPIYTTMGSRGVVNGLIVDSRWYFRVRIITKDGSKAWSSVVSIIVA
jgi:hypothetical protein